MNRLWWFCLSAALVLCADASLADTFGSGANAFNIDFVTIGNPGNPPDAIRIRQGLCLIRTASANTKSPSR